MANDTFLKLSGISGSATDSKHKSWIEITEFSFNISKEEEFGKSTSDVKAGGDIQSVSISKKVDKASTYLADAACSPDKTFNSATVALCGQCGPKAITATIGGLPVYMKYTLTNVVIKSYTLTGGSGYATESLDLGFSEITWSFTGGGKGGWKNTESEAT
ncbi:MAG: type VI secretion system secreted protein Hcp [Lentimonas sp.]|jgi:type VI secretion system secreted protein Hcp